MSGHRVGVDMEDWFSEDLMPEARKHRPVRLLQRLEQTLLRGAAHSSCPSQAMSEALAKQFGCRPPTVIYNAFPWAERAKLDSQFKDRRDRRLPSVHWFSQTLGPERGLEDLLAALPHLKHEAEIHLRGKPVSGFHEWLGGRLPETWRSRVWVHNLISNDELLSRIAEHDIGFAGEMKYCRNKELTVSNKILHYLLGGLAVVASDTTGQREIAEQAGMAVSLYRAGDPVDLAEKLDSLLGDRERLAQAKSEALRVAEETFCWERQAPKLLRSIEVALSANPP
jgi:glycosyltransferase involved in cell wall biosynthesis